MAETINGVTSRYRYDFSDRLIVYEETGEGYSYTTGTLYVTCDKGTVLLSHA